MPFYKHVKVFSVAFYKVGSFRIPSLTLILFFIVHVRQAHQHFTLSVTLFYRNFLCPTVQSSKLTMAIILRSRLFGMISGFC